MRLRKKKDAICARKKIRRAATARVEEMESRLLMTVLAAWSTGTNSAVTASPFAAKAIDSTSLAATPGLTRDSGLIATSLSKGFASSGWSQSTSAFNGAATTADLYFDLQVQSNVALSLSEFDLNYRATSTGPHSLELDYSRDNGATYTTIASGIPLTATSTFQTLSPINLSGVSGLQQISPGSTVRIRIAPYGATGSAGTFAMFDSGSSANDMQIQGASGSATAPGTPSIGSFTINPQTVSVNTSTVLTASNVIENGGIGSITAVSFYLESNPDSGLQISGDPNGNDTFVGIGSQNGSTWTLNTSVSGMPAGSYNYYAVATDSNGNVTTPSSTNVIIVNDPTINFAQSTFTANEADGTAFITVNLTSPPINDVTVNYATSDGSAVDGEDYASTSGTLTFSAAASDTSESFTIPLTNNKTFPGTRTLNLALSNLSSSALSGATTTAKLAITDNTFSTPNGIDTPTGKASLSAVFNATTTVDLNSFLPLTPTAGNGFGSGANVGPDMPFLEFSNSGLGDSNVFSLQGPSGKVDSIQLALDNTATTGAFGGIPGKFDVYVLSGDTDPAQTDPSYLYLGGDSNTGPSVIGTQGAPVLIGSANFNNVAGYSNYVFDNLSFNASNTIVTAVNTGAPIRFVITPSLGSNVAADWEGNFTSNQPQLTLLSEIASRPTVTGVTPLNASTSGGDMVVINGTGFTGTTAINFGGTSAASFVVNSDTQITAIDPAGSGTVDVTVVAPGGTSATSAGDQFVYGVSSVTPPNLVGLPVINGDNPDGLNAPGSATPNQRSMVEDIVYTFDAPVNIANAGNAFTVVGAGLFPGTAPATLSAAAVPGSNGTQWAVTLTDSAPGVLASIVNGEYTITVNGAGIVSAADNTTALATGAGRVDSFYRLYGDVVNGDRTVNAADNLKFKAAINGAYNPIFDINGDGSVNAADNLKFKQDLSIGYSSDTSFIVTI